MERIRVLANVRAGRQGEGALRRVEEALRAAGVRGEICPVPPERLAAEAAREAEARAPVVAVCGGDGTLLSAAGALAGSGTALAPLPTGTLNHFARRLGVGELQEAARSLAGGCVLEVPVGVLDDRVFLNTATFGLYADVVRRRERLRRWLGKWPAAAAAFAVRLLRLRRLTVVLEVQGKLLLRETPLVWVGVGWGSFPRVHQAPEHPGGPQLEIVVLRPGGRLGMVTLLARTLRHARSRERPVQDPALEVLHARSVLIHAARGVGVTLDGEPLRCRPPLFVAVQEGALRVVAPARPPAATPGRAPAPPAGGAIPPPRRSGRR